jgi:EpsI family protein
MHMGWEKLKKIAFPIVIIPTMFPLPDFFHFPLTLRLKLLSSQIGVWILQAYGMSAYREGNIIDLGFTQLQVVDACSGLRYLFPLIIMAVLLAYFYRAAFWKKVILVLSAIPLTIITNSMRIAMTGILFQHWGPKVAEGFFHGFSGWAIFIFGMAVLLFEMWLLNGFKSIFGAKSSKLKAESSKLDDYMEHANEDTDSDNQDLALSSDDLTNKPFDELTKKSFLKAFFAPPQFVVAVLLLGVTLAVAQTVEFREKIPPAQSFSQFPTRVGEWNGKRGGMEQLFIDELDLSDYVIVDYQNGSGKSVNFYTAYYETQRKGESIHSPETCLPGGGWEMKKAGRVSLPLLAPNGEPMRVNKALIQKGAHKQLSYFWFPQRDRVLTNAYELKIYNFWDALTRQRTDGALVRLITPVYEGEKVDDADARLLDFTRDIVPVLNEFLPD